MSVARITLRWEWMRPALFMSRHGGIPTGPVEPASWVSSVEVKTWCIKTCHKYLWRCIACSSPTLCLQISLSSWMKVLYFLNTSCNIPILKPNTSASVFTFLITLSWLLKKDRDRFFSWFTHCRLLAQMHFSWFSGNTTVGLECIYISVCFQRHSRGCFPTLRFVFSCIKIIMSNPLLWVASLIT